MLANGSTSAPLTFYLGHCTALVTGAKREFLLPSLSPWPKDDWLTGADQPSCPGAAHAHLRTGGHLSHYPLSSEWKTWTLFQTCANCAFPSYIYAGGKQKCVRKKPELSTSAHVIWENWTKSSYSGFPLLCQTGLAGARRVDEGLFLCPRDWSCLISSCHHPSGRTQYAGLASCCIQCPSFHTHWLRMRCTPQRVSWSLPPLGALIRLKSTGTTGEPACSQDAGTALDMVSAAFCGRGLFLALWLRVGPLEALCTQDILPVC